MWPHVGITWLRSEVPSGAHTRALGGQPGLCLHPAVLQGPARPPLQVHQAPVGKGGVLLSQIQLPSDLHSQTFIKHLLYALPVWEPGQQTNRAGGSPSSPKPHHLHFYLRATYLLLEACLLKSPPGRAAMRMEVQGWDLAQGRQQRLSRSPPSPPPPTPPPFHHPFVQRPIPGPSA